MAVNPNSAKQKLAYESYYYRQQLGMLKKEIDRITLTMLDLVNASKTVKSLDTQDSLVPIGGNAFIETKITSAKILVPIGGGYLLKLEKEPAKEEIEKRIESTKKVIERLQDEYKKMNEKLIDVETKIRTSTQNVQ